MKSALELIFVHNMFIINFFLISFVSELNFIYFFFFVSEICMDCFCQRLERERQASLTYERATIYIKCIEDAEPIKTQNVEVSRFYI